MPILALLPSICNFSESLESKSYIGNVSLIEHYHKGLSIFYLFFIEILMYCALGFIGIIFLSHKNVYWRSFQNFSS